MLLLKEKIVKTVQNSKMSCAGIRNKGSSNGDKVDSCGVMVYQSFSGDAEVGRGYFTVMIVQFTINDDNDEGKKCPFILCYKY